MIKIFSIKEVQASIAAITNKNFRVTGEDLMDILGYPENLILDILCGGDDPNTPPINPYAKYKILPKKEKALNGYYYIDFDYIEI